MTPKLQTRKEPNGDCLRAAIATLLDLPIEQVPDWIKRAFHLMMNEQYATDAMHDWLNDNYNLQLIEIELPANMPWYIVPHGVYCILFGETKNGFKHATVGICHLYEFLMIHNPWPEAEILSVSSVGFLVPRDPGKITRK